MNWITPVLNKDVDFHWPMAAFQQRERNHRQGLPLGSIADEALAGYRDDWRRWGKGSAHLQLT
ncbi:MAG: hypothetical protein ABI197_01865, partial [Granulicella sp.]